MPHSLIKFQIGPVQDFIAAARSTRDLWSGSYLLSWLAAAGIRKLQELGGKLIFPNPKGQPLLEKWEQWKGSSDHQQWLIPNLPNIFIAKVEGDAQSVAQQIKEVIEVEWKKIAEAVWCQRSQFGLPDSANARFDAQVARHLSVSWQVTPLADDKPETYAEAYRLNGWHLDAVRQTRDFQAWASQGQGGEKDSLTGKEEALIQGSGMPDKSSLWHNLFNKHRDHLGAVSIIKRCWHLAYLKGQGLKTESEDFVIRSIPAIAARIKKHDDNEDAQERVSGEKYIAAIAFDGDSIGAWVNGDKSPAGTDLEKHHEAFSLALSHFALIQARVIVEGEKAEQKEGKWKGQLIYAGGDDVLALVPANEALAIAKELRTAFCSATKNTHAKKEKPDASAGIAIAHIHAPLQDLIREAQKAEKRAKNIVGRPAFSVTLMKRSGEISYWGSKWEGGGSELYQKISKLMAEGKLSGKFPHRVCQLLEPYLTVRTGLSKQEDAIQNADDAKNLILREVAFTAERQGSKEIATELAKSLTPYLDNVIEAREARAKEGKKPESSATQELLTAVIGLCTTVAFAERNRKDAEPSAAPADTQTTHDHAHA